MICNVFVLVASAGHCIRAPYSYISMSTLYFSFIILETDSAKTISNIKLWLEEVKIQ